MPVAAWPWGDRNRERHLSGWSARAGPAMVITHVDPRRLGWVISSQSERYVRTGLHMVHATVDLETGEWIEDYLEQVRGLDRIDPLRSRVAELIDSGQRFDALRLVRASAPDLGAQGAKEYVEAAAAGMPVPEEVRARLPRPPVRRRVWWRLSEPNPEP